ncbi:MAG TPA: hypothetical protein VIO64_11060 [Pseudobacteroides sp.]|uniref:hypothetical protein n=1 Tax=Pseudobacteroides sp. TaxID=1968840 RepID=UPI002F95AB14
MKLKLNKVVPIGISIAMLTMTACSERPLKDNKVYYAKETQAKNTPSNIAIKTQGTDRFFDYMRLISPGDENRIIASVSPDKKRIIFIDRLAYTENYRIKGENYSNAEIMEYNTETKTSTLIGSTMIKTAKWNKSSDRMAFIDSNNMLNVYDTNKKQTFSVPNTTGINSFVWSEDGTKIYFGTDYEPDCGTFYVDSKTTKSSLNSGEKYFLKGYLDENYRYAIKTNVPEQYKDDKDMGRKYSTKSLAVIDNNNIVAREFDYINIKDSYKRSLLLSENDDRALYYYQDIEQKEPKIITTEYILDTRFVAGGNFIFITQDPASDGNYFYLNYADNSGNIISKEKMLSSRIYVAPDGKSGIGNLNFYKVSFGGSLKVLTNDTPIPYFSQEDQKVVEAIRGAVTMYATMTYDKEMDFSRYFTNSQNPEQSALYEVTNKHEIMKKANKDLGDNKAKNDKANSYIIDIILKDYKPGAASSHPYINYYKTGETERANANIVFTTKEYLVSEAYAGVNLDLIKQNNKWLVTGISTFPSTQTAKDVRKRAEQLVKKVQDNGMYGGILKNKAVIVGQVQFWSLSEPHFAPSIEAANHALVYLKANDNGTEKVYKMTLQKQGKSWDVVGVRENSSYGLF